MSRPSWNSIPWREQLAWCGGYFSGEGSIFYAHKHSKYYYPTLAIGTTNKEEIDKFQESVLKLGRIYGPYGKRQSKLGKKPIWRGAAQSLRDAQAVVVMLWPYLSDYKKAQAIDAFSRYKKAIRN